MDRAPRTPRTAEASGLRVLLRFTPAYDPHVLCERADLARELMVDRGGLRTLPGEETIPVVVDHNMDRRIGVVREMFTDADTDGRRWNFRFRDAGPEPARVVEARYRRVMGLQSLRHAGSCLGQQGEAHHGRVHRGDLRSAVQEAAEPLARVLWVGEIPESPAAGGVFYGGEIIVRHGIGQVLGVR